MSAQAKNILWTLLILTACAERLMSCRDEASDDQANTSQTAQDTGADEEARAADVDQDADALVNEGDSDMSAPQADARTDTHTQVDVEGFWCGWSIYVTEDWTLDPADMKVLQQWHTGGANPGPARSSSYASGAPSGRSAASLWTAPARRCYGKRTSSKASGSTG
jgi:hypothetical protein